VNIARGPESYRPIRVPSPGHGVQRPWIRVGSANPVIGTAPRHDNHRRRRQIEGLPANPMPTVQNGWRTGGFSALHRDFPVDGRTRQPISGIEVQRPVVIHSAPVQPPVAAGTRRPSAPVSPSAGRPVYGVQHRRGVVDAPASTTPPVVITGGAGRDRQRDGSITSAPPQTYTPPTPSTVPDHPVYMPPPAIITGGGRESHRDGPAQTHTPGNPGRSPQNPVYMPPPAVISGGQTHPTQTPPSTSAPPPHPTYTPPPAATVPHPTYTPPPARSAPQHPTYTPPPAPSAAPRSSAPPPSSSGEPAAGARTGGHR
jgi:hypothetical protein